MLQDVFAEVFYFLCLLLMVVSEVSNRNISL